MPYTFILFSFLFLYRSIIDLQYNVNFRCKVIQFYTWWWFKLLSRVQLLRPMDCSPQAPLSMGFSRQEYWSGLPFPSSGGLLNPGIKPGSPALQADSLATVLPGKPVLHMYVYICIHTQRDIHICFFSDSFPL